MRNLLTQRKDLVVKIGNRYEISWLLFLELYALLVEEVLRSGASIKKEVKVEVATSEMVILSLSVGIITGNSEVVLVEVGEAYSSEKRKETSLVHTAYIRGMKRLLERIAGEDFINRFIRSLYKTRSKESSASEKQRELIRKLATEERIATELIESLKEEGILPQDFSLKTALEDRTLTSSQAKAIISRVLNGT